MNKFIVLELVNGEIVYLDKKAVSNIRITPYIEKKKILFYTMSINFLSNSMNSIWMDYYKHENKTKKFKTKQECIDYLKGVKLL
jgi:hypothetical protein